MQAEIQVFYVYSFNVSIISLLKVHYLTLIYKRIQMPKVLNNLWLKLENHLTQGGACKQFQKAKAIRAAGDPEGGSTAGSSVQRPGASSGGGRPPPPPLL
jgi:hypothetical protein